MTENNISYLVFTYRNEPEYTGDILYRWSYEKEVYYVSDKVVNHLLVVVKLKGISVGYASLEYITYTDENGDPILIDDENDTDEICLKYIEVNERYQGYGIGTELLRYCLNYVSNLGLSSSIVLSPDNTIDLRDGLLK